MTEDRDRAEPRSARCPSVAVTGRAALRAVPYRDRVRLGSATPWRHGLGPPSPTRSTVTDSVHRHGGLSTFDLERAGVLDRFKAKPAAPVLAEPAAPSRSATRQLWRAFGEGRFGRFAERRARIMALQVESIALNLVAALRPLMPRIRRADRFARVTNSGALQTALSSISVRPLIRTPATAGRGFTPPRGARTRCAAR